LGRRERCSFAVDDEWNQPGHAFDLHVAVLELPFVVLFQQHSADQPDDRLFRWKDAYYVGTAFDFLLYQLLQSTATLHSPAELWSSSFAAADGLLIMSPGGSLLYEFMRGRRLRMGYGQELEGASLFAASEPAKTMRAAK
jgi:hypothetical protein